jgi:hypothetical protein
MIDARHPAVTATLLAVRIEVADFDGLAAAILPFNLNIGFVHHDRFSRRYAGTQSRFRVSVSNPH